MFDEGSALKKYFLFFVICLIAIAAYLYNYSLNIHVQKLRVYTNLYLKHDYFTDFAESILLKENVKGVGFKYGAVRADYFQPTPEVSKDELENWEIQLKKYSIYSAKIINGEVIFHVGSIPYKNKTILVSLVYKSDNDYANNCLIEIKEKSKGRCFEQYNKNWLVTYFWYPSFIASQTISH